MKYIVFVLVILITPLLAEGKIDPSVLPKECLSALYPIGIGSTIKFEGFLDALNEIEWDAPQDKGMFEGEIAYYSHTKEMRGAHGGTDVHLWWIAGAGKRHLLPDWSGLTEIVIHDVDRWKQNKNQLNFGYLVWNPTQEQFNEISVGYFDCR